MSKRSLIMIRVADGRSLLEVIRTITKFVWIQSTRSRIYLSCMRYPLISRMLKADTVSADEIIGGDEYGFLESIDTNLVEKISMS